MGAANCLKDPPPDTEVIGAVGGVLGEPGAEFDLIRVEVRDEGAFGVLKHDGLPFAVTLERTFGQDDRVLIPPGDYVCRLTVFHGGGYETYEIPVRGHDHVKVHIGNLEEDSTGCVLVGLRFGPVKGSWGVLFSRLGFLEFMKRAARRPEIRLRVREVPDA